MLAADRVVEISVLKTALLFYYRTRGGLQATLQDLMERQEYLNKVFTHSLQHGTTIAHSSGLEDLELNFTRNSWSLYGARLENLIIALVTLI